MESHTDEVKPAIENKLCTRRRSRKNFVKVVRMYKCTLCNEKFSNKNALGEHKATHNPLKPFECLYCNYKSSLKDIMKNHMCVQHGVTMKRRDITHKKFEMVVQEYKCMVCNEQFPTKAELHDHHATNASCKPFECLYCDQKDNLNAREEDMEDFSEKEENMTEEKIDDVKTELNDDGDPDRMIIYKCRACNKQFNNKTTLHKHTECDFGSKPFGCKHCDYRSSLKSIMKNHLEIRHGISIKISNLVPDRKDKMFIQFYKCATCSKVLSSKERLQKHLFESKQCKPFKCSFCNYRNLLKNTMKRHMQSKHGLIVQDNSTFSNKESVIQNPNISHNNESDVETEIKMEIDINKIFPDFPIKEENIDDDEQLSDMEVKYNINSDFFLDEKPLVSTLGNDGMQLFAKDIIKNEDVLLNTYIKEEMNDDYTDGIV